MMHTLGVLPFARGIFCAFALLTVGCDVEGYPQFPAVIYSATVDGGADLAPPDLARPDLLPVCVPSRNADGDPCGCIGLPCCFNSTGCEAQMNCVVPTCWGPGGVCVPYGRPGLVGNPCSDEKGNPGGTLCENGKKCLRGYCLECDPNE